MRAGDPDQTWLSSGSGRSGGPGHPSADDGRGMLRRTRRDVSGAGARQWLIAASLVAGAMLGFLLPAHVGHWLSAAPGEG